MYTCCTFLIIGCELSCLLTSTKAECSLSNIPLTLIRSSVFKVISAFTITLFIYVYNDSRLPDIGYFKSSADASSLTNAFAFFISWRNSCTFPSCNAKTPSSIYFILYKLYSLLQSLQQAEVPGREYKDPHHSPLQPYLFP